MQTSEIKPSFFSHSALALPHSIPHPRDAKPFVLEEFTISCAVCQKNTEDVRGELTDFPSNHMTEVVAVGFCRPCLTLTQGRSRIYHDGRLVAHLDNGWTEFHFRKDGWFTRLRHWLKRTLEFFR